MLYLFSFKVVCSKLLFCCCCQGSTKSGLVGETSIDFADYADAIKTCNVSLPLQNSISKALLHVSSLSLLLSLSCINVSHETLTSCKNTKKAHKIFAYLYFERYLI